VDGVAYFNALHSRKRVRHTQPICLLRRSSLFALDTASMPKSGPITFLSLISKTSSYAGLAAIAVRTFGQTSVRLNFVLAPDLARRLDDPRIAVGPAVAAARDQADTVAVALHGPPNGGTGSSTQTFVAEFIR
jgi:hypothetical protein